MEEPHLGAMIQCPQMCVCFDQCIVIYCFFPGRINVNILFLFFRAKLAQRNPMMLAPARHISTAFIFGLMIPVSFSLFPQLGKVTRIKLSTRLMSHPTLVMCNFCIQTEIIPNVGLYLMCVQSWFLNSNSETKSRCYFTSNKIFYF